ncbi:arginine--tRNA ligase [Stomatobaculum longum]|uniref:arginine--tRNA ligase n=1 Tax=Stomatobaculum longum TaxID=796942 RepID=UPI0028EF23ED|nr:arginine--tRNA ligase [Stomatobaculum longum]
MAVKTILEEMNESVARAFAAAGYPDSGASVQLSNRPDLCEYQCNGAMAVAKKAGKRPLEVAEAVAAELKKESLFSEVGAVPPGFINLRVSPDALATAVRALREQPQCGAVRDENRKIVVDYGGANVAKPLHVGHLRSAIIGEALKRMGAFFGNEMIGDVHLGDWGLQMGLIIEELRRRKPELPYFDESHTGDYPEEAPFTISELEEIYPTASKRSKEDEAFAEAAHLATVKLQSGDPGFTALWKHILRISKADLKKNYDALAVSFELWKGESDAQPFIPALLEDLEKRGIARSSEGALVVDIAEPGDKKELPPCIVRKSDGAALYATSDLATLIDREATLSPDCYIYIADKRQELHYTQFFRVARKAGIVPPEHELIYIGFGTMNGKDGKPFKTREGGVMRLETLIREIREAVSTRIAENPEISPEEAEKTSKTVALAALKYADLSNQASKDYVFDLERFASFEGNTGPYILYTAVRIKSILKKYANQGGAAITAADLRPAESESEKALFLDLARYPEVLRAAWRELAPHRICQYLYELSNHFNSFYHAVRILQEPDEEKKRAYLSLIQTAEIVIAYCLGVLGMEVPERM